MLCTTLTLRTLLQVGSLAAAEAQQSPSQEVLKAPEGAEGRIADSTGQADALDAPAKPDQPVAGKPKRSGRQAMKTEQADVHTEDKSPDASPATVGRPARGRKAAAAHVKSAAGRTAEIAAAAQQDEDVHEAGPETEHRISRGTGAAKQGSKEPDQDHDAAASIAQPAKRSRGRLAKTLAKKSKEESHQDAGEAAETAQQAEHGMPSRRIAKKGAEQPEQAVEERSGAAQQRKHARPRKGVVKRGKEEPEEEAGEAAGGAQQARRSRLKAEAAAEPGGKDDGRTDSGKTDASVRRLAALTESQAAADTLAKVGVLPSFQGLDQQHGQMQALAWQMHVVVRNDENSKNPHNCLNDAAHCQ